MVPIESPGPGGAGQPLREADAPLRGGADAAGQRAKQESVRLNYGSLYAVVESLEKKGFIKATGTVREGKRPERTVYEITDDGVREMNEWMTELISTPSKEYPAFLAGLSFLPSLPPDEALAALRLAGRCPEGQAGRHARRHEGGDATPGLPRIFELETEYEEQQLPAELKFVTALVEEMSAGTLEGLEMWRLFHTEGFNPGEVEFTFDFPEE